MQLPNPEIVFIGPKAEYSDKITYGTMQEAYEYCKDKEELAVDIETTYRYPKGTYSNEDIYRPGLDPYLSLIVMVQIGDKDKIFVIDTRTEDISILKPLFEDRNKTFVGHNLVFEAKHLQYNYGILFHKIHDTLLVDQNLTNGLGWSKNNKDGLRYSLEALAGRYLGIKPVEQKNLFTPVEDEDEADTAYIDKSIRMGFLTIGDKPFTEEQILYGADDILYPILIKKRQLLGTGSYNPIEVHELENEFCLVLADIELKGIAFDKEQWLSNVAVNKEIFDRRLKKLNNYVEANYPEFCEPPNLFNSNPKCSVEWTSSKQVIKLFKHIGFCPQEKSKQTGYVEYTVGAKSLQKLLPSAYKELYEKDKETEIVEQKDLILNYLLFKVAEQAVTTFGKDFLKYIHPITGRLHTQYKQILHTGRISSNKPNLQNIPQDEGYRKAFTTTIGNKLVDADYSSQESRILAELSGDEAMISFFNDGHPVHGEDYHSFTATKMFSLMRNEPELVINKKTHPEERNAAKNISFKIAYGGSAYTLKDDFGVEEEVAQEFIDSYLQAFPALDSHFKKCHEKALKNGYIDIIPDRRYYEPRWSKMKELSEKAWAFYPKNYKDLGEERKKEVKEQINKDHPEIKGYWKEMFTIQGEIKRAAQNFPIQGAAGAQTKKSAILFRRHQMENNIRDKMWLCSLIHDEIVAETVEQSAEECKTILEKCMIEGGNEYCKKINMNATGVIGDWWYH